ncbi:hypothetical protein DIPPA_29974 [Diplonema papillatum]|nr:hypothetical protein DIPPA_29974 [Diplonema papillatum]
MATDMTVEEAERQLAAIEADTAEAVAPLKQRVEELEVDRAVREARVNSLTAEIRRLEKEAQSLNQCTSDNALAEIILTDEAMTLEAKAAELEAQLAARNA